MAKKRGPEPVVKLTCVEKLLEVILPLVEVFRNIETVVELFLVTTKSSLLSPSKSAIAIAFGPVPIVKSTFDAKLPVVMLPLLEVLRNTETVFVP